MRLSEKKENILQVKHGPVGTAGTETFAEPGLWERGPACSCATSLVSLSET